MADISKIQTPDNTEYNIKDANVPHSSLTAASGGTDLSLVTTGEKHNWNKINTVYNTTYNLNRFINRDSDDISVTVYSDYAGVYKQPPLSGAYGLNYNRDIFDKFVILDDTKTVNSGATVNLYNASDWVTTNETIPSGYQLELVPILFFAIRYNPNNFYSLWNWVGIQYDVSTKYLKAVNSRNSNVAIDGFRIQYYLKIIRIMS